MEPIEMEGDLHLISTHRPRRVAPPVTQPGTGSYGIYGAAFRPIDPVLSVYSLPGRRRQRYLLDRTRFAFKDQFLRSRAIDFGDRRRFYGLQKALDLRQSVDEVARTLLGWNVRADDDQHDRARFPKGGDLQRLTKNVLVPRDGDPAFARDSPEPFGIRRSRILEGVVMPYDRQARFFQSVGEYPVTQVAVGKVDPAQAARS